MTSFGDNVRTAMTARGFRTAAALAEALDMREGDLSRLLNAKTPNPRLNTLFRIAKELGVSIESLVGGIDPKYDAMRRPDQSASELVELVLRLPREERVHWVNLMRARFASEPVGP